MPNMRQNLARRVLSAVLFIELIGGIIVLVGMLPTFPASGPDSEVLLPLWISLLASVVLGLVWVGATLYGVVRNRGNWVRASSVVIHILMFAAGTGVLQGILGTELVGWMLVILAFVGFISALLLRPSEPVSDAESAIR
ncbi:MAG: hypothetical protein ACTIJ6_06760 [Leucobacter sp.]